MTPLLARIDRALSSCVDPQQRAELLAERACYLARIGDFTGANEIASSLRGAFGDGTNARISVWIMLIEGLVLFYEKIDPLARDRLFRACAISEASELVDLTRIAASWLAHLEFNRYDFPAMKSAIMKCRPDRSTELTSWHTRVCLVVADSYMYTGQSKTAQRWYERARRSAVSLGDEASIAALIYNKASMGLARLRIDAMEDVVDHQLAKFLSLEVDSARNFHAATRHSSLSQLIDVCRARVMLFNEEYTTSLHILESILHDVELPFGYHSDRLLLQLEYVRCLIGIGSIEAAMRAFLAIDPLGAKGMTSDDRYVFLASYMKIANLLGMKSEVAPYVEAIDESKGIYLNEIDQLECILVDLNLEGTFE